LDRADHRGTFRIYVELLTEEFSQYRAPYRGLPEDGVLPRSSSNGQFYNIELQIGTFLEYKGA
jgi:hypothetical protein